MIIGMGTDLVDIPRIEASISRHGEHFLQRIFTPTEQAYCSSKPNPAQHYAARFAAKEACAKALGSGIAAGIAWLDMEVVRDDAGRPSMELSGRAREAAAQLAVVSIYVSLTHTDSLASATVLLEG